MFRLVVLSPCWMLESPGDLKYVDAWALPQTDLINSSCGVAPGDSILYSVRLRTTGVGLFTYFWLG